MPKYRVYFEVKHHWWSADSWTGDGTIRSNTLDDAVEGTKASLRRRGYKKFYFMGAERVDD